MSLLPEPASPAPPSAGAPPAPIPPRQQAAPPAANGKAIVGARPGEGGSGVQIGALSAPDPSSAGLLAEGQGGLPTELWKGSPRTRVEHTLRLLPASPSPAAQRLSRRLLLSIARVPEGPPQGPGLLALRIQRLIALGDGGDAAALAALAPSGLDAVPFNRAAADAAWLKGDTGAGCAQTAIALRHGDDLYWDEANAFCQALDGRKAQARLTLDLLRDGNQADPGSLALLSILSGESDGKLSGLPRLTPLTLAMLREAKRPAPADALKDAGPAEMAALAGLEQTPPALRLIAAERAVRDGALPPAALAALYAAVPFTQKDMAKALQGLKGKRDAQTDAMLYQGVQLAVKSADTPPAALAKLLHAALTPLYDQGGPAPLVRTLGPVLVALQPSPALADLAGDAGRALLALGQSGAAKGWLALAQAQARGGDGAAGQTAAQLWALLQLAEPSPAAVDEAALRAWWQAAGEGQSAARRDKQAALLFTLLEALGRPVPPAFWAPLYATPLTVTANQPAPAIWRGLADASKAGRLGETLTFALLALGEGGTATASAPTLSAVIGALRPLGLGGEANNLALEAALANGL